MPFASTVSKSLWSIAALWWLLCLTGWAESAAMVSRLSSPPPTLEGKALQLFDMVPVRSRLEVPSGGKLTLSFVRGGLRVSLQGPGSLRVEPDGVSQWTGKTPVQEQKPQQRLTHQQATAFNWDRMAGVSREDLRWTLDNSLMEQQTPLLWEVPADLEEVEVTIEEKPDFVRVLRQVYPARGRAPQIELKPGASYVLQLRGFSPRRTVEAAEHPLRVLSLAESQEVERREQLAKTLEERVELCSYLLQMGLRSRAREVAQSLLADYPEQPRLRQLAQP